MKRKFTDEQLIEAVKNNKSIQAIADIFNASYKVVGLYIRKLKLDISHFDKRIVSQETRDKISKGRSNFLQQNPSKHNWSAYHNQETKPEKIFKEALLNLNISAIQYYMPPQNDRRYELDFAIPEQKIAFEINGNQHYENGKLAQYYQDRHDYFVNKGWKVHEIHYSECLKLDKTINILSEIIKDDIIYSSSPEVILWKDKKDKNLIIKRFEKYKDKINNFDEISNLIKTNFEKAKILIKNINPKSFPREKFREKRPSKRKLLLDVWSQPSMHLCKKYKISDRSIGKWCVNYNIPKPPRGYWVKTKKEQEEIKKQLFEKFNIK